MTIPAAVRHALAAAALMPAWLAGQQEYESVLSYRTVKVAAGIYAFITPEERTGVSVRQLVAIIGDDGVLVFDTGNLRSSTRRQIAEIRQLTDKPVRYVVNSHWHPDHNLGNGEYRAAFPNAVFIGSTATRTGIIERVPMYPAQMKRFAPTDSAMRLRLSTGRMRDGSDMPADTRLMWGLITRDYVEFCRTC